MKKEYIELYNAAIKAREMAYTPYSNFKVGASLLLDNGKIIRGFNIENSSYGLCNCAERNTLFRTYMEGYTKENIKMLMVIADTDRPCSPCGACRQVMSELMELNTPVILTNLKGDIIETTVNELIPYSFNANDME